MSEMNKPTFNCKCGCCKVDSIIEYEDIKQIEILNPVLDKKELVESWECSNCGQTNILTSFNSMVKYKTYHNSIKKE